MRHFGWIAGVLGLLFLGGALIYRVFNRAEPPGRTAQVEHEPDEEDDLHANVRVDATARLRAVIMEEAVDAGPLVQAVLPPQPAFDAAAADAEVSPDFAERLAQDIPQELNARLGRCYDASLDRNASWLVTTRASFLNGEVAFMDVRVIERNVQAPDVELCITRTISAARWAEPGAPPRYDDELEIQVSQRGMKKHGPRGEEQ